jgi:hypothetical protein
MSDSDHDPNPRPLKRPRTTTPSPKDLERLPEQQLLLALPSLLIHPPGHKYHAISLYWSVNALRRCLTLENGLEALEECRIWTSLAEVGMMAVEAVAVCGAKGEWEWAKDLGIEVSVGYRLIVRF